MKTDMGFSEMQEYIWRLERRFVEDNECLERLKSKATNLKIESWWRS